MKVAKAMKEEPDLCGGLLVGLANKIKKLGETQRFLLAEVDVILGNHGKVVTKDLRLATAQEISKLPNKRAA